MENTVKIHKVIRETRDAVTLQFENHPSLRNYSPGQFINIYGEVDNETISRSYSFSSSPLAGERPSVTIKKMAGGRLSRQLVETVEQGDSLTVSEPAGRFGLRNEGNPVKHMIFIAGGSGITPLFAMIKTILNSRSQQQAPPLVTLLYSNKEPDTVIFGDQLDELEEQNPGRFSVVHFLQKWDANRQLDNVHHGYINKARLAAYLDSGYSDATEIYLCGPEAMMQAILKHLEELNFDRSKVYSESYQPTAAFGKLEIEPSTGRSEITFLKGAESFSLELSTDEFILQTGLNKGLKLPHSCKEAMCGACKVKLLSGKVNMVENYALTDSQLKEGYVLLCSGKPVSDAITLSYT
ncbi:MAG: ferredoxin--NADP reductase [Imperialibacter sp.]|uniref:ferredoxin--NADP reductase n=1 Tax=Imperialibacter sp. TaxID=2038411 RepID=UPI0032EC9B84